MLVAAMRRLRALPLALLRDAIAASGSRQYIEMVLRFVVPLLLRNQPQVYTEEATWPIAWEEEMAKVITATIVQEMDSMGHIIIVGV